MISDDEIGERMLAILNTALERTERDETKWRPTDDEDAFLFSGSKTSLVVDYYPRTRVFELRVLNSRGTVVSSLKRGPNDREDPFGGDSLYESLEKLHDLARRSALDIDGTLNAAMDELTNWDEPPF